MAGNTGRPQRRSIRLAGYDYAQAGAYFVTICTQDRACLFGDVVNGNMRLNVLGQIVDQCWRGIPAHGEHAVLDAFVVMPNHIHGIIAIVPVGATHASPALSTPINPPGPKPKSIAAIIGSFKSAATRRINEVRQTLGMSVWQRNYYERIIRDEHALDAARRYVQDNPAKWEQDSEKPLFRPY